jgi:phosphatidate phosphatase LPIN
VLCLGRALQLDQVDVSVNGRPIPFCMKIGEAGEAFFVFETTYDVPDELITSPIIQPTRPDDPHEPTIIPTVGEIPADDPAAKHDEKVLEPEFFDLDSIPPLPLPASVASHEYPPSPLRTPTITSSIPLSTPSTLLSRHVRQGPPPEDKFDHPEDDGQVLHGEGKSYLP